MNIFKQHFSIPKFAMQFVTALLFLVTPLIHAATWTVCSLGCDFTTIQSGINGSLAGDTLDLDAQGFAEQIIVDKDLTLKGAGQNLTSIYYGGDSVITIIAGVTATIRDLEIYGGMALEGGGIRNSGTLTVIGALIRDNFAIYEGGGIWTEGDLVLKQTTIRDNAVDMLFQLSSGGGGIYVKHASGDVMIKNSTISWNVACNGGGILNDGNNDITILRSTIEGNEAGPGMMTCPGFLFAHGGGILNIGTLGGLTKIRKSTISGNSAAQSGGGIANLYDTTMTITNSTISGNEATFTGGGLYVYDFPAYSSTVVLNNSTVTDNSAADGAGMSLVGGIFGGNPTITSRNTIVADQATGNDCYLFNLGSYITAGHNIESDMTCSFTDIANGDQQFSAPGLIPLANNGGPTQTHALPLGSPAVDTGDPAGCRADMTGNGALNAQLLNDQRGQTRSLTICDVGAYELQ